MTVSDMHRDDSSIFNIQIGDDLTWNVTPLLHEIRHALDDLVENGNAHVIDLRSIPLAPGEEQKILDALGQGEVHAELDALGPSEIIETAYTGVWLVTHYNSEGEIISRLIEINTTPEILLSPVADMRLASDRLAETLKELPTAAQED